MDPYGKHDFRFVLMTSNGSTIGSPVPAKANQVYRISIITDQYLDSVSVTSVGGTVLSGFSSSQGRITLHTLQSGSGKVPLPITVTNAGASLPKMSLCRSLSR
jgi:hypothetical protein